MCCGAGDFFTFSAHQSHLPSFFLSRFEVGLTSTLQPSFAAALPSYRGLGISLSSSCGRLCQLFSERFRVGSFVGDTVRMTTRPHGQRIEMTGAQRSVIPIRGLNPPRKSLRLTGQAPVKACGSRVSAGKVLEAVPRSLPFAFGPPPWPGPASAEQPTRWLRRTAAALALLHGHIVQPVGRSKPRAQPGMKAGVSNDSGLQTLG